MNFDPKAVRRALMIAKDLAVKIDPGFAVHNLPMPPEGVPLERAKGGPIKTVEGTDRERNLAAFMRGAHPEVLDKNGRPKVFYHGTIQPDIRKFESGKFDEEGKREDIAAHFALAPDLANHFAQQWQKFVEYDEKGNPIIPNDPRGAVVYPAHLNIKNIFDPRNPKHLEKVGLFGEDLTDWKELEKNSHWIKKAGFDSYYDWEDPNSPEPTGIAVFDPKNIKSAVGNVGTFDPTNPDITKAEGGSVDDHPDQGYTPKPPGVLDVDNPGGDWLKENREYSESRGYLPSGAPKSFGKTTAVWREPNSNDIAPVYLPVSMLAQLPGVMGEQRNVRSNDLDWLVDHMGKTGKLPKIDGREYKPFITVDHRGRPFVSEGNHRIMAAAKLGWDYLPVEVRYFNGAEDVDGPLHPDRIKAMQPPKKQIGGAVEDDDMPARRLDPMGTYSAAAEAALNLPQERGTLQQMLASLKGVKPDEINFSDVQNRLGDKPIVTKQELADYFSRNIPKLEVTSFDEDSSEAAKNRYTDIALTMGGKESNYAEDLIQYSEPWLLTMSPKPAALKASKNAFYTEHYPEIPNILAHVRRSDREGPNGEKLLHLEELQSDWGQTGKKHGFENPVVPGTVIEDPDYPGTFRINWQNGRYSAGYRTREIAEGVAVEGAAARAKYTPLVPHVGTTNKWMDLALKRALNIAAKGNYDGIIWTPGDKQVERYKGIGEIGEGLKYLYDNIVPKQLLGLAKEHDPSAKVESLSAAHDPIVDGFPLMRISPKMRESIKKRGFKAFSTGGFAMPQPVDSDKTIRRALMIAKR